MPPSGPRTPYDQRRLESYRVGMDMPAADNERSRLRGAALQLLVDHEHLSAAMQQVCLEWPDSCAYYLTHSLLNDKARAEWLCRAACFLTAGAPDGCGRSAWEWLTADQQNAARKLALTIIRAWKEGDGDAEALSLF